MSRKFRWFLVSTLMLSIWSFVETANARTNNFAAGKVLAAKSQTMAIASWKQLPLSTTSFHNEWLTAPLSQRISFAEQIGEEGAMVLARQQRWTPLLTQDDKFFRQGFDQVYRRGRKIIIVEAKGGTSQLGRGYGYTQGTREWAVGAARKTVSMSNAREIEKQVAERVLKAYQRGHLEVYTVRTKHYSGQPIQTFIETSASGKIPGNNVVSHTAPRLTPRALATTGKIAGRAFAGGLGVVDVAYSGYRLHGTMSHRHEFDDDIYAGKIVAESGMGLSGAGLLLLTIPEPTGLTKVAGVVLLASSLAFGAADITLDYAHANRASDRQRLLDNLDTYEKHDAVDSLLRKMIDHDNMVLY